MSVKYLLTVLAANILSGYLTGYILSFADTDVYSAAVVKAGLYENTFPFFIKSVLCGIVMYVAVKLFRKQNIFGILIGVPLFIMSGMQHSIANIITLGIARSFSASILLCIAGNFMGAILIYALSCDRNN